MLLGVEGFLWLADWTRLPPFGGHKGWAVLTAVAAVAVVTLVMAVWWLAALLLRWRFQFGIRTLLVLSVSVAVPCGWIGAEAEHARRQRQVVQEIEAKGGWLRYDYQFYPSGTLGLGLRPPGPAWLQAALGKDFFGNVVRVSLSNTVVDDAWLRRLGCLRELRLLWLDGATVTDAGLAWSAGACHT